MQDQFNKVTAKKCLTVIQHFTGDVKDVSFVADEESGPSLLCQVIVN